MSANPEILKSKFMESQAILNSWNTEVLRIRNEFAIINHFGMTTIKKMVSLLESHRKRLGVSPKSKKDAKYIDAPFCGSELIFIRDMIFLLNRHKAFTEEVVKTVALRLFEFWMTSPFQIESVENVFDGVIVKQVLQKAVCAIDFAFRDIPLEHRGLDSKQLSVDSLQIEKGGVYIVNAVDQRDVYSQILNLHAVMGYLPERHNLLLSRESTDWEEVLLLLLKWRRGGSLGGNGVYYIANPDILKADIQIQLVDYINSIPIVEQTNSLILICGSSQSSSLLFQLSSRFVQSSWLERNIFFS